MIHLCSSRILYPSTIKALVMKSTITCIVKDKEINLLPLVVYIIED